MSMLRGKWRFIVGALIILVMQSSYASFPSAYQYQDTGWGIWYNSGYTCPALAGTTGVRSGNYSSTEMLAALSAAIPASCQGHDYNHETPGRPWSKTNITSNVFQPTVYYGPTSGWNWPIAATIVCPTGYTWAGYTSPNNGCKSNVVGCPVNATLTGSTCTCNTGFNENNSSGTMQCSPPCPASYTTAGNIYLEEGTNASAASTAYDGADKVAYCMSGCMVASNGGMETLSSYLVSAVKHYVVKLAVAYVGPANYCAGSTSNIIASIPASTCGAGQLVTTSSAGQVVCLNPDGSTASDSGVAKGCGDVSDSVDVTNGDSSHTVTTTVTDTCTGKKAVSSVNYPAGVTPVVPPHATAPEGGLSPGGVPIGTAPGGGGSPPVDPTTGKQTDSTADFCAKNPTSNMCKTTNMISEYCAANPTAEICLTVSTTPATLDGATDALNGAAAAHKSALDALGAKGQDNEGGLFSWLLPSPVEQDNTCSDPVFTVMSGTSFEKIITITGYCAKLLNIRLLLGWIMYVLTAIALFHIVTGGTKETA